jgi:hypothetical protein
MVLARSCRRFVLLLGASCALVATAATSDGDGANLKPVKLAPKAERAAPPPPVKAYAIDGKRFYYGGRQFVIEGLDPPRPNRELAKQHLQQILDSGELTLAPVGRAPGGATRVHVSIDGQPLSN